MLRRTWRNPAGALVTGCLFHREHPVPYELPGHKTRSVFKSLSSPGGGGYNELRIEAPLRRVSRRITASGYSPYGDMSRAGQRLRAERLAE